MRLVSYCCVEIVTTAQVGDSTVDWFDREHNYSMVVQAICDSDLRFQDVFTGLPGSVTDSRALRSSGFFRRCDNEEILNGPVQSLHVRRPPKLHLNFFTFLCM